MQEQNIKLLDYSQENVSNACGGSAYAQALLPLTLRPAGFHAHVVSHFIRSITAVLLCKNKLQANNENC